MNRVGIVNPGKPLFLSPSSCALWAPRFANLVSGSTRCWWASLPVPGVLHRCLSPQEIKLIKLMRWEQDSPNLSIQLGRLEGRVLASGVVQSEALNISAVALLRLNLISSSLSPIHVEPLERKPKMIIKGANWQLCDWVYLKLVSPGWLGPSPPLTSGE